LIDRRVKIQIVSVADSQMVEWMKFRVETARQERRNQYRICEKAVFSVLREKSV